MASKVAISDEPALNDRMLAFAREYVIDCSGKEAAIRAGYSEQSASSIASQLLTNGKLRRRIQALQRIQEAKAEVSVESLQTKLVEITDRCMQAEPVLDRDGNHVLVATADGDLVPAYQFNPTAAARAIELVGKTIGAFTEKVEITGADGAPLDGGIPLHLLSEDTINRIKADIETAMEAGRS